MPLAISFTMTASAGWVSTIRQHIILRCFMAEIFIPFTAGAVVAVVEFQRRQIDAVVFCGNGDIDVIQ